MTTTKQAKTQHTPGPWSTDGHMIDAVDGEGHRITVASVNSCWHGCGTQEGNAALVAAAPDLLEALKAVVSVADRQTDEFDLARAAIAKATGK